MSSQVQYYIKKQDIQIPHQYCSHVKTILYLEHPYIFVYLYSGQYIYYNLTQKIVEKSGKISNQITQLTVLCQNQVAYIDLQNFTLQVLDLETNQLKKKFAMELPTNAALSKTEKAQDPSRAQQIAEQQITLVSLTQSKLLIICEEKITNNKQYEYVITVLSEESLPQTYCQFVYNAGNNPCQIKNINKKDIIVLWPEVLYNQELQFLAWNVLLKEKGCQQLQFKDQLNASIIGCSSWGANKIAFWANPTYGGRPEIKIMNTKDGTEFRGLIDCYEDEWLLCEMIHIDTEKNLAFINRIGHESTLDLIYLGKFKKIFSHKIQDDEIDLKRHFSLDNKQYIAYSDHTVGQFDQKNKELSQFNCIQLQLCQFEQFIPSRQTKLAYLMNQKNMFDIYGEKNIKKVIDFMSTRQSPIKQSIQALTKKQNNSQ